MIVTGALRRIEVWDPERWAAVAPAGTEKLAAEMAEREHQGDDADRWVELAAECIANLPAEEI